MRIAKALMILLFKLFFAISIFATAQEPDKIIYNGSEYKLHTNPMNVYFKKYPDKKPQIGVDSSGLWRGYVATFEFIDNTLFLKDISILVSKKTNDDSFTVEWKSVISEIVPNSKRLKIDWFTGILVLPFGEVVRYVHIGYASTYENYLLLELKQGEFMKAKEFGHEAYEKFKARQFEAFKDTKEYDKLYKELMKDKRFKQFERESKDVKFIEEHIRRSVINYIPRFLVN